MTDSGQRMGRGSQSVTGDPMCCLSAGAEYQGPAGGVLAVLARG